MGTSSLLCRCNPLLQRQQCKGDTLGSRTGKLQRLLRTEPILQNLLKQRRIDRQIGDQRRT